MEKDLSRLDMAQIKSENIRMKNIKENIQFIQFFVVVVLDEFNQRKINFNFSKPLGYGLSPKQMVDELKEVCINNDIDIEYIKSLVLENLQRGKKK